MPQPGSPVNKATLKEQRAAQRAKKLEVFHRQQKRSKRNRLIGITSAIVGGVAVIGLVVTMVVLTPQAPNYAGGDGAAIEGVLTYENGNGHVETGVTYPQTPPTGGEHNPAWLNCGVYDQPVPSENAVHSLEHGAIWVTYDPSMSAAELDALKALMPSDYIVLSPFEGLPSPIVLSAWNAQLQVESTDDPRIEPFFQQYWKSGSAPELGASCSGAIDAPGKVS